MYINDNKFLASLCRKDFYTFLQEFWEVIIAESYVENWHIPYLCNELQLTAERVFRKEKKLYDIIINIPPGTTKSTIVSQMYPAWIWTNMLHARIIGASYTLIIALDQARKNKDIVSSSKYKNLFGISLKRDQSAKGYFVNNGNGYRYSVGIGGSVTSMHAHFLLIDDPLNPKQAASKGELESANRWMSETLPTRKVDKEVTPTILIMQRLNENDPTGFIALQRKDSTDLKHIVLPAESSDLVNPPELKLKYINNLLDPVRLNKEVLNKLERDLGAFAYSGQIEQNPISRTSGMFRPEQLIRVKSLPCPLVRTVRAWDKAGSDNKNCYTAGSKLGLLKDGSFIILDMIRFQAEPFRRNEIIKQTAEMDGKSTEIALETEPGSAGIESSQVSIRQLAGYKVRAVRPSGSKEVRADPLASMMNSGNMYIMEGDWNKEMISELMFFPLSKYKDQVDSLSLAFSILTGKKVIDYKSLIGSYNNNIKQITFNQSSIPVSQLILPNKKN